MNILRMWKHMLVAMAIIVIAFIAASLIDIILAAIHRRFYSMAAFIVIFGVAGIFAGVISYTTAMEKSVTNDKSAKWSLLSLLILTGLCFFFVLAKIEGGEYEIAFKSFGVTLAASSFLFINEKTLH